MDWARLQSAPHEAFNKAVIAEYREFFDALHGRGVRVLLVLHHFAHPEWFEREGGWTWESNLQVFYDYTARCIEAFGDQVYAWNTFNEPNFFALNAYYLGNWPPYEKSLTKASRVLGNMAQAHLHVYGRIKEAYPMAQVGYSLNTAFAEGRGIRGQAAAKMFDWWFYQRPISLFKPVDFIGISYFAYVVFAPDPITALDDAARLDSYNIRHDKLWGLKPAGLAFNIRRAHKSTGKPVWIMENGVCTDNPDFRIEVTQESLQHVHACIREGIPVIGYTHWNTWDSFEWDLGPNYRFGLLETNYATFERSNTPAADWYEGVCRSNSIEV